jgi:hypothetical protein
MWRMSLLQRFVIIAAFLALALFGAMPVFAQSDDGVVPDGGVAAPAQSDAPAVDKDELAPGESSSVEAGDKFMYLPFAGTAGVAAGAVVTPTWQTVFLDHMCAYPSGWLRNDYNGTGHAWVYALVDGVCTAQPNAVVHKMNVTTTRVFSLAGALKARATFRFKMNTEALWDYLRVEYSCNGGKTYWGLPSQYSGAYGWSVATVPLDKCAGNASVRIRFTFQTDRSILSTLAPVLDYVKVEKYQ